MDKMLVGVVFGFLFGVAAMMVLDGFELPRPTLLAYSVHHADNLGFGGR